jgi:phosphatidylserine/phosphatidylglycerophosphate/cardiolipin synthase-like enzyme
MKIFCGLILLFFTSISNAELSLKKDFDYCQVIYGKDVAPIMCAVPATPAEILKDPYEALNARFKLLMGYDLGRRDYLLKNPRMPLDFSKAPKLDLIILDTLQIMKDFVGVLHLRMLKHHLSQGTKVYFMTSGALLLPHEIFWLRRFRRQYPEMHFTLYRKNPEAPNVREILGMLHRNNHVKALLTYSKNHPENNAFISGGRNVTEQYFYTSMPDNSAYPEITQWNKSLFYRWTYNDDLDFKITDTAATEALARSLMAFNESRQWSEYQKPMTRPLPPENSLSFFISYPFDDGKGELEDLYVQWIDSATRSLHITSPYVNMTKKIKRALLNAQKRGVDIYIATNLDLRADILPFILQPGMVRSLRQISQMFKIYYYGYRGKTLHTKSILIDDEKLILGSANLNQRSFKHDTEIIYVLTDPQSLENFKKDYNRNLAPMLKRLTPKDLPTRSIMESLVKPLMPEL